MSNPRRAEKSSAHSQDAARGGFVTWLLPALIVLATCSAFLPALKNEFVNWDDNMMLFDNPNYRGLTWAHLQWMFTTFYMGHYQPLSWMTFGLDYLVWGMDPFGYHLTNLLLHAANAVVLYFLTLRLLSLSISFAGAPNALSLQLASGFAALFFSIHPLRVESVAWATERRDILSGLFFLLTILFYLRAATVGAGAGRWWGMSGALFFYGLSLLAKAIGVTLPLVLVVLDIYPLRRLGGGPGRWVGPPARKVWMEKYPFFFLATAFSVIALLAQREADALRPFEKYGLLGRSAQAVYGLAFYLVKTALPLDLSPLYELPRDIWTLGPAFILSGALVLAASLSLFLARRRWPAGLACWVCYVVVLFPVLGFFQAGPQLVADRYSYLSCLGWAVLSGAGLFHCWRLWLRKRIGHLTLNLVHALAAGIIFLFAAMTWRQAQVWHDSERLWRHAVAVAPGRLAHSNLASLLRDQGNTKEAVEHYRRVLEFSPSSWKAHNDLAVLLDDQGRIEEAVQHYRTALQINPSSVDTHYNLGMLLVEREQFKEAMAHLSEVLRLSPAHAKAHLGLGIVLANLGQVDRAIDHLQQALKIQPDFADAHYNLGRLLGARGDLKNAIEHFRRALRIQPDFAEAHEGLGRALARQGKREEATQHYQEALRILKSRRTGPGPSN